MNRTIFAAALAAVSVCAAPAAHAAFEGFAGTATFTFSGLAPTGMTGIDPIAPTTEGPAGVFTFQVAPGGLIDLGPPVVYNLALLGGLNFTPTALMPIIGTNARLTDENEYVIDLAGGFTQAGFVIGTLDDLTFEGANLLFSAGYAMFINNARMLVGEDAFAAGDPLGTVTLNALNATQSPATVPVPAAAPLLLAAIAGLVAFRRRVA